MSTPARSDDDIDQILHKVAEQVHKQAEEWRDRLSVSIGRARDLTGMDDSRIRYFEDLGVLRPEKTSAQSGGTRLYSLSDLRCLYALSLLVKNHGCRPAEAARIVNENRQLIESGKPGSLIDILKQESEAVADGFVLARLVSQLMDAAQAELSGLTDIEQTRGARAQASEAQKGMTPKIIGIILPMRPVLDTTAPLTDDYVRRKGKLLARDTSGMLIALDRGVFVELPKERVSTSLMGTGRNDSTVLFYSHEPMEVPLRNRCRYCVYAPKDKPHLAVFFLISADDHVETPPVLAPQEDTRTVLLNRVLSMCESVFLDFRSSSLAKNYRYRSDGFQIEHTQVAYKALLERIQMLIFPDDPQSMAVILIPNSLDRPASLSILSHSGYDDDLAPRAKLDVSGEGQGLSGRAYKLREPFFSQNARTDPRIEYAMEEHSTVAAAIPFVTSWGLPPFGVLYLASRSENIRLESQIAYLALILGNILSELLGRWWLTRLRREQDRRLHSQAAEIANWVARLDQHGPDFARALDQLAGIWQRAALNAKEMSDDSLALVVFDIDQYRQNVQERAHVTIPLHAQAHVHRAIQKIVPEAKEYWFKNDHACLVLDGYESAKAVNTVRRIANQVMALPLDLHDTENAKIQISVSAAIKILTYRDLHDIDHEGGETFRNQMQAIIDDMRKRAAKSQVNTIQLFASGGWVKMD